MNTSESVMRELVERLSGLRTGLRSTRRALNPLPASKKTTLIIVDVFRVEFQHVLEYIIVSAEKRCDPRPSTGCICKGFSWLCLEKGYSNCLGTLDFCNESRLWVSNEGSNDCGAIPRGRRQRWDDGVEEDVNQDRGFTTSRILAIFW